MTDYTTVADVKARLSGDTPTMSGAWDGVLASIISQVSAEIDREVKTRRGIRGAWSFVAIETATEKRYRRRYSSLYLPIDDCIEVTAVDDDGTALVEGTDYEVEPLNDAPYIGLTRIVGAWSPPPRLITVTAKWGFAETLPTDVAKSAEVEVIRSYLGARAGYDDRIGMTPFGRAVTARAFTDETRTMLNAYRQGGGFMR